MTTKTTATTKPAASSGAALRVAAYLRVSTGRQAEADLSLPDQRRQAEAYCAERGWRLAAVFEDAGASGTDEDRPEFRRLIAAATGPGRPFDVVLVHSLSRFARDLIVLELSVRRLERAGVRLVSITQEMADGPDGALLRRIVAAIDEHHSRENARQGFWNGARPPFGHRTAEAGRRGPRVKKVLAVDEAEAAVVRRIFGLYLGAEGAPLGVKAIAARLDAEGVRHRGKPFAVSNVHRILTAETSAGRHWFDRRDSRSRAAKPRERWVGMDVPPLVPRKAFERVQEALAAKSPRRTPPGVVSGSILLTGLAECASCGGGMTLRTGKGGRYRHYACATCAHRGRALCPGRSVPMDALDRLVLGAFAEKVLTPPRLERILAAYVARSAEAEAGRKERLARLRAEATEARAGVQRLLALVEAGQLEADDPDLRERLAAAKARRWRAEEEIALLEGLAGGAASPRAITPAKVARLGEVIRRALEAGDPAFRRAYLRLFVSRVVVADEEIRITGPTDAPAAAAATDAPENLRACLRSLRPVRRCA